MRQQVGWLIVAFALIIAASLMLTAAGVANIIAWRFAVAVMLITWAGKAIEQARGTPK